MARNVVLKLGKLMKKSILFAAVLALALTACGDNKQAEDAKVAASQAPVASKEQVAREQAAKEQVAKTRPPSAAGPQATALPPPKPTSPDAEVATTDKYYDELKQANIAFSTPPDMDEDATANVVLWLDPTAELASLENALRDAAGKGQRVEGTPHVKWSPRTQATLSSPGFDIAPQSTIEQAVSAEIRTEWTWQIHPRDSGKQTLHLALEAVLPCADRDCVRVIKTFDRDIKVEVSPPSFVRHNWQWLVATLVIPFTIWLWNRRRRRR